MRKPPNKSVEDYLEDDGLGCFLSGKYASKNSEAGMLGYVQSDDVKTWIIKLQEAIEHSRLNNNNLLVLSSPCAIHIVDAFADEWISEHKRDTGQPITIHHILLDYYIP